MTDLNEAIRTFRSIISKITGIPNNMILSGESIRGPELVTIKNGQKIPIGYDENCIVHYVDPTNDMNIIDTSTDMKLIHSYELHLIVYGNDCKAVATKLITNLYTQEALDMLRDGGIGILKINPLENTSEFLTTNTYVLRYDIRILFDCQIEPERSFGKTDILEADQDIVK